MRGGETTLRLDAAARRVLELAGVRLSAIGEARADGGRLSFPISGGELIGTPPAGEIQHRGGGLRLSARDGHVDAGDLVVDTRRHIMIATIQGHRVPLLRLDLDAPSSLPGRGEPVVIPSRASLIGETLVAAIGDQLGVDALTRGLTLGSLRIAAET